jgi:hypothetical protein
LLLNTAELLNTKERAAVSFPELETRVREVVASVGIPFDMLRCGATQPRRGSVFLVRGFVYMYAPALATCLFTVGTDTTKVLGIVRLKQVVFHGSFEGRSRMSGSTCHERFLPTFWINVSS